MIILKVLKVFPGTGKTHTLVEIIRQLIFGPPAAQQCDGKPGNTRVLVCGASNLSVDNILERILKLSKGQHDEIRCTRIGHPARIMGTDVVLNETLDAQVGRSDQVVEIDFFITASLTKFLG